MRRLRAKFSLFFSLAPALLVISTLFGASVLYGAAQSFGILIGISDQNFTLEAYKNILLGQGSAGREFWMSLGFSLWIAVSSTFLSALGAIPIAIWLNGRRGWWQRFDTLVLNWNLSFPHLVWAIGMLLFFSQSGLLARIAASVRWIQNPAQFPVIVRDRLGVGIIIDYVTKEIPFLSLMILAVLRTQPENYDLVAENLGATRWQRVRYVTIPQIFPSLLSGALLVFAYIFSAYEVPALLGVRYPRMLPVMALNLFTNPDLNSRSEGMVISFIITFLVVTVAIINLRLERQSK